MPAREFICTVCGTVGRPRKVVPGSFLIEAFAWLVALALTAAGAWPPLLLALAYTLYRATRGGHACNACGAAQMVPLDSPVGRELSDRHHAATTKND